MKRLLLPLIALLLTATAAQAKMGDERFNFRYYLRLMSFGDHGQTLDKYRKHAAQLGLDLVYHAEETAEIYLVWAKGVGYSRGHMTETYTRQGDHPRCLNMDLTPNGRGKYSPITVTIVFPDKAQQMEFWQQGLRTSCQPVEQMEDTDIDPTWTDVSCLRYNMAPGRLLTWHYIYFYEKDGMPMCTFLF